MSIRDTSAQDHRLADASVHGRRRRQWALGAGAGVLALGAGAWLLSGWSASGVSVSAERLRIAEVKRGDLIRDITADGRVIAANSPVLYAIAGGSVDLKVVAGDVVRKGQVLAEIDSPELRSKLAQEQATLASLEAEASRAELDGELARSTAQKELDQAQIDRVAAQRDLERYQRAFEGGAVAKVDVAKAQ
ncbi:biotin/lipoyl-binding protein, partial [Lysobacter sp. 2RAB21]